MNLNRRFDRHEIQCSSGKLGAQQRYLTPEVYDQLWHHGAMKNSAAPSFSQEFEDMPNWDRSFWLSRAFIEASRCLCTNMIADDFSSQYSSSRVILHLARHGIELFLKAAIWASADQPAKPNHNLEELFLEYRRIYPDSSFLFEIPSRFKVDLNMDLFPEAMKLFHSTLDQRHRYPAGRNGDDFATPEIFDPAVVLKEILALDKSLKILEFCKIRTLVLRQPEKG